MAWALRLVKIDAEGKEASKNVMEIGLSSGLGDLSNLGLSLTDANLVLARVGREISASQVTDDAGPPPETPQPPTSRRSRTQPGSRAVSKKPASPPHPEDDEDPVWGDLLGWMRLPASDPSSAVETPISAPPPNLYAEAKSEEARQEAKEVGSGRSYGIASTWFNRCRAPMFALIRRNGSSGFRRIRCARP